MYSSKIFNTLVLCTSLTLFGCQSTAPKATTTTAKNVNQVQQENANGFKARIAVSSFTDKSNNNSWWNKDIGNGMADQLTTALVNTNRFIVLERANLDTVMAEQDLVTSGRVSQSTGAAFGQIEGAELAVIASVTEYDDSANGATASSGGLLGDVFQSVSAGFSGSHMAIDLRLVDTRTSRILFATSVEGGNGEYDFNTCGNKIWRFNCWRQLKCLVEHPTRKSLT